MNITDVARNLYGDLEETDTRLAEESLRERNYLQRKLDELDDDQVYEMDELESGWSVIRYTVTKRTAKFIHLRREAIYARGFRLPRKPLESGGWVLRRPRFFELGRTIRPRLEELVRSYTATIADHEAAARQRAANQRRWGLALTDEQFDLVHELATDLFGIPSLFLTPLDDTAHKADWMKEGF